MLRNNQINGQRNAAEAQRILSCLSLLSPSLSLREVQYVLVCVDVASFRLNVSSRPKLCSNVDCSRSLDGEDGGSANPNPHLESANANKYLRRVCRQRLYILEELSVLLVSKRVSQHDRRSKATPTSRACEVVSLLPPVGAAPNPAIVAGDQS